MRDIPNIALLFDTSYGVRRDLLRGIARYARQHGPWSFSISGDSAKSAATKMDDWHGRGVIGKVSSNRIAQRLLDDRIPGIVICLSDDERHPDSALSRLSELTFDAASEVARLATQHFLELGFRNFGYVGLGHTTWSLRRECAFCERLQRDGFVAQVYRQPKIARGFPRSGDVHHLSNWIQALPKPAAILACNDERGRQVLDACNAAEVRVPDDVAVLGVDNDVIFCEMAEPQLSSIALNAEFTGYQAAEVLDCLMSGRIRKPRRLGVAASGIVVRQSTEMSAVPDKDVAAAIRFIRGVRGRAISVGDVVNEVVTSRRTLEKRFRQSIGRTVLDEIHVARLQNAKGLLLNTVHSIREVASLAGFGTTEYFIRFFRRRVGMSPRRFRDSHAC